MVSKALLMVAAQDPACTPTTPPPHWGVEADSGEVKFEATTQPRALRKMVFHIGGSSTSGFRFPESQHNPLERRVVQMGAIQQQKPSHQ
ncbi:unnamed protein product [Closterium sp. Yama58-4]|nr:unnamed protein product [Closterium sp. Yama58-4]